MNDNRIECEEFAAWALRHGTKQKVIVQITGLPVSRVQSIAKQVSSGPGRGGQHPSPSYYLGPRRNSQLAMLHEFWLAARRRGASELDQMRYAYEMYIAVCEGAGVKPLIRSMNYAWVGHRQIVSKQFERYECRDCGHLMLFDHHPGDCPHCHSQNVHNDG